MVQSPSWEANWFAASQEIPRISRNPKVHYRTHKRPPPFSILGEPNPVHIPTSHLLEIHPDIIHPSTPRSPQWSPSLRSSSLCRVFILIFLRQTMSLGNRVLQLFCCYYSLLLLYDMDVYYYYYYYYYCLLSQAFSSRYFSWTSGDPHRSSFTLQYFPYFVWCSMYSCLL